jgi:O-antigen polymerase
MKNRIFEWYIPAYFTLSVLMPFLSLREDNYYLNLNFNGVLILNFVFIFLGVFALKSNWEIGSLGKGLLMLTIVVLGNLLVHGILKNEWINFSYILSVTLFYIIFKNIKSSEKSSKLNLFISLIFASTILIHLFLAFIHGYNKLGFTNGCFINPGHFSSFLIIFCPFFFSIAYFKKKENKESHIIKIISWLICVLIFFLVAFNNTRTCWVSAILMSVIYHWIWKLKQTKLSSISISMKVNQILRILFIFLLFFLAAYFAKKDSSDGRLLIWKLSIKIFEDNPLFGIGYNKFQSVYNLYQSDYFKNHSNAEAAWLSDNVLVAYNEFLQSLVELGFWALLLFIYLIVIIVKKVSYILNKNIGNISIKDMSLIGFIIVVFLQMSFSYPFRIIDISQAIFLNFLLLTVIDE